ncbi:hypothetical protein QE152_g29843 [Popillia japonica]|uniref:Uncharacterized protein n=1 Tax=Popillia japonica TaxID=7064 RepID=A0AAW1JGP4_POPJA
MQHRQYGVLFVTAPEKHRDKDNRDWDEKDSIASKILCQIWSYAEFSSKVLQKSKDFNIAFPLAKVEALKEALMSKSL